jgi:hypothetical protein
LGGVIAHNLCVLTRPFTKSGLKRHRSKAPKHLLATRVGSCPRDFPVTLGGDVIVHPLDGADARVTRSRERFDLVNSEWNAVPEETKTITLASKYEPDLQTIVVSIASVLVEIDPSWSFVLSEALFHLRAALDYMTWELAAWNLNKQTPIREPSGNTQ